MSTRKPRGAAKSEPAAQPQPAKKTRQQKTGRVTSDKMQKTIVVAVVKPGRVLFELGGVREDVAKEAMRLAANKLPIKTKFIVRQEAEGVEA